MSTYRTQAFILRRFDAGEKDSVIHIYGPTKGFQSLISKSTRTIKSKLRPFLEPFREVDVMIVRGKSSEKLVSVSTRSSYKNITKDTTKIYLAYNITESILHIYEDTHSKEIYNIMKDAFSTINNSEFNTVENIFVFLNVFYLKILNLIGMRPETEVCCVCHKPVFSSCEFSIINGGVVHSGCCKDSNKFRFVLDENFLIEIQKTRKNAEDMRLPEFANLVYNYKEQERLYNILSDYWQFRLEKPIRTKEMIQLLCQI